MSTTPRDALIAFLAEQILAEQILDDVLRESPEEIDFPSSLECEPRPIASPREEAQNPAD